MKDMTEGKKHIMQNKNTSVIGVMLLLICAFVWGTTFVAQSTAADTMGPFTYLFSRSIIATVFLSILVIIFDHMGKVTHRPENAEEKRNLRIGGFLCGVILCYASFFQQYGIAFTTVGKAGFITAFYIVMVPVLGIFLGKRPSKLLSISVLLALLGLYFLCMTGSFSLERGDTLVLLCALVFSFHILTVDHFSPLVDGVRLSRNQFLVVTILSFINMLLFEKPTVQMILSGWFPILYAGIMSSGIGYTFQILGQEKVNPTLASLLMSLESVFSAISGAIVLGERMSGRELLGCILVFSAVILAQLPTRPKDSSMNLDMFRHKNHNISEC